MSTTKRLYRVDWHGECFVMAEGPIEAKHVALAENMGDLGLEASAVLHVSGADGVPSGWAGSIPFGSDDDRTVAEILAEQGAAK